MALPPVWRLRALTWMRQRRRRREFHFRFGRRAGLIHVQVRARHDAFAAEFALRPIASDLRGFEQIFLEDFYNFARLPRWPELRAAYDRRAQAGPQLILDLGANIGLSSQYLARLFPEARILAVEPDPENFALLERNLAHLPRTQPLRAAAGAGGFARILDPGAPHAARRTAPAAATDAAAVPVYSVDQLLALAAPAQPWLVKIDIEGAEAGLFQPAGWVEKFPILTLEPHDWMLPKQAATQPFLRAIHALDRDFLLLGESVVSIAHRLET